MGDGYNTDDIIQFLTVKRRLAPNTIRLILSRAKVFSQRFSHLSVRFTKVNVETFIFELKEKGLDNDSINSYIFMFQHMYAYFKDRGRLLENFIEGIENLPKTRSIINVLTLEEIESILQIIIPYGRCRRYTAEEMTLSLNTIYHTFTSFLARTGARFNEAALLRCKYLDLWDGRVTFVNTKNKVDRSVWITDPLITELKILTKDKNPEDYVFLTNTGNLVIPQNYSLWLRRAAKQLHITKRVHPHLFRHSFATSLYASTKDIGLVQIVLGHKDIKSTMIYIHLADDAIKRGLYRHPYNRKYIDTLEYIRMLEEHILTFGIDKDNRFDCLAVKRAVGRFLNDVYGATTSISAS